MKFNFLHFFNSYHFKSIAWLTFIVYFITALCGWTNFLIARITDKYYFPLKSYLLIFDKHYNGITVNAPISYKIVDEVFFIIFCSLLVILFYAGYKAIEKNKISQIEIIKWSIIFSVLMALAIPSHSSDLYGYIARGAQQTLYKQNPYIHSVSEIQGYRFNPLFLNFMWTEQTTTYGPVFTYLSKVIVQLSNNNVFLSFLNFKLLNLTVFFLIILFALKYNFHKKDIYLLAWNPLILIHGLWNSHNDLLSGALIFFGVSLLLKQNYFWSIFCLTIGAGIKYSALLIIPIIIFYFLKNRVEKSIFLNFTLGFCSGLILILIFSMDYIMPKDMSNLNIFFNNFFTNIGLVHESLTATLITLIKYFCNWLNVNYNIILITKVIKYIIYFLFSLFYLWAIVKKKSNLIFDIILVLFIFLSFTLAKFHSWYLLNMILLIPFLENSLLKKILIALCITHTFAITFLWQAKILNFVLMTLFPVICVLIRHK